MKKNKYKSKNTYMITKNDIVSKILNIFSVGSSCISFKDIDDIYFDINFPYKEFLIHIYTNVDNFHKDYQNIEIKKISDLFEFEWTPFYMLLAYYDDSTFDIGINITYLLSCLIKLKEYIDKGKVFLNTIIKICQKDILFWKIR